MQTVSTSLLVAFDADDTLWVNEPFYQEAQRELERIIAAHSDEEDLENRLYSRERHNLEIFGYGAKGFTLSMIETAIELSQGAITGLEIQGIIDVGKTLLRRPIELLPGVRETLEKLALERELMIITKGDLFDQESKVARSGLSELFSAIEIVSEKSESTYRDLVARHGRSPEDLVMIGNSLRSDILPVVAIGGQAVHIPCDTTWQHERVAELDREGASFHELSSISQVPEFLRKHFDR